MLALSQCLALQSIGWRLDARSQSAWSIVEASTESALCVLSSEAWRAAQMLAAKAYDLHNAELQGTGLTINTPETMWNVPLAEVRPVSNRRAWTSFRSAQNSNMCHTRLGDYSR